MKALNPINKKRWTLIFILSNFYDITVTLLMAYVFKMGIYQEGNNFVRLMLMNGYYQQFIIMELTVIVGLVTIYRWLIDKHNIRTKLFQYELRVNRKKDLNQFLICGLLGILKGCIFYIPFAFIFGGSTWIMGYFGII